MNTSRRPFLFVALAAALALVTVSFSSCNWQSASNINIQLINAPSTLTVNQLVNLTASVANDSSNAGVDWSCGGSGNCGTFDPPHTASGGTTVYTAPSSVGTVTLTAAATANSSIKSSAAVSIVPDGTTESHYPLKVSSTGRYLVNQQNIPFLMIGDAPQSLIVNASVDEADYLLGNRKSHGFNAVWIMLICNTYSGGRADASTFDGIKPFTTTNDLSTPNEAYFARCDEIIRSADSHGLNVILDPIDTGGLISTIRANGVDKCYTYGRFLGNRYETFDNIIWMSGSDFQTWSDPSDDAAVKAVASGIKDTDSRHIHTVELNAYISSSLDDPNWSDIVTLNAAYTYYPTYAEVLKDYNLTPIVPVFLIEADYESEHNSDPERLRRQEYWSLLSGACGYVFGNGYVWPLKDGWKDNLDTVGVQQFGYCRALFQSRLWYSLVPDQSHKLITAGYGTFSSGGNPHTSISESDYVTAASTPDGKLALVYIPTARTITVDLTKFSGLITARWYDPTTGDFQSIAGSPFANTASQAFITPGSHADGASDWVLVLESQ